MSGIYKGEKVGFLSGSCTFLSKQREAPLLLRIYMYGDLNQISFELISDSMRDYSWDNMDLGSNRMRVKKKI